MNRGRCLVLLLIGVIVSASCLPDNSRSNRSNLITKVMYETIPWYKHTRNFSIDYFNQIEDKHSGTITDSVIVSEINSFCNALIPSFEDIYNVRYKCSLITESDTTVIYIGRNGIMQLNDKTYSGGVELTKLLMAHEPDSNKVLYSEAFTDLFIEMNSK